MLELCAANGIEHEVRDFTATELYRADEAFCSGTMGELAGITAVDGRTIGTGESGPITSRLSDLYREETRRGGHPILDAD